MGNNVHLEVRNKDGAILSYFLKYPDTRLSHCTYVEATRVELAYLDGLQDCILPPGQAATLSDLQGFRKRLQDAKAERESKAKGVSQKAVQAAPQGVTSAISSTKEIAKASLIADMRKLHKRK